MPGVVIKYINMAENKEKLKGPLTTNVSVCNSINYLCGRQ